MPRSESEIKTGDKIVSIPIDVQIRYQPMCQHLIEHHGLSHDEAVSWVLEKHIIQDRYSNKEPHHA